MKEIKIVFFDIDGTLANGLDVPESAQRALKILRGKRIDLPARNERALRTVAAYKLAFGYRRGRNENRSDRSGGTSPPGISVGGQRGRAGE